MQTVVSVIQGKNTRLIDVKFQILPRVGESLRIEGLRYEILEIERSFSTNPDCHDIRIHVR